MVRVYLRWLNFFEISEVFIKFRWHDEKLTFAYQWVRRTILFIAFRTSGKVLNVDPCFSAQSFSLRESGFHAVLAHSFVKIVKIQIFLVNFLVCFDICFDFLLRLNFRQSYQIIKLVKNASFICQAKNILKLPFFQHSKTIFVRLF